MFGSFPTWSMLSGGFVLPYDLGEQKAGAWGPWEHFEGKRTEDGKPFSVFRLTVRTTDTLLLESGRNCVRRMRMTKHPRIPAFEWAKEKEDRGSVIIYLVTEPLTALTVILDDLALEGLQREMFVSMGIRHIAQAVTFLNSQCKLIHGNVSMATVLVTDTLDWKLGYLDTLSEYSSLSASLLARCTGMTGAQYKPAELVRGDMEAVSAAPPGAVDSWGMGCLMQEVFSGCELTAPEQLRNTDSIPKDLLPEYQKLLNQNPARRLSAAKLADSEYLKNDLVDTMHFLESLSIREVMEKDKFFRNLPRRIPDFPVPICIRKLLPLISDALEYGGAPAMAVGCLLQVGKLLGPEEFKDKVVPIISALFSSTDRSIRRSLIDSIGDYAPSLTESVVESSIYPQLTKGLAEPNAYLREQTLKAMLPLAPKLSQRTLNTSLLKHLAKLQVDDEPSIRANTTVLLGNIAHLLGDAACKRILLNAFTRALKDVFAPSRVAALKALMATSKHHTPDSVAHRVVPSIAPMVLDPSADVRKVACKALNFFVQQLNQAAENLDNGVDVNKASASQESADLAANVSSYMGWAMTTIAAATVGVTNTPQATPQSTPQKPGPRPSTTHNAGRASTATHQPSASFSGQAAVAQAVPVASADDGWGDMDEAFEDPMAPPSPRQSTQSAVGRLASVVDTSSLDAAISKPGAGDGWDDDFELQPVKAPKKKPTKLGIVKKGGGKGD